MYSLERRRRTGQPTLLLFRLNGPCCWAGTTCGGGEAQLVRSMAGIERLSDAVARVDCRRSFSLQMTWFPVRPIQNSSGVGVGVKEALCSPYIKAARITAAACIAIGTQLRIRRRVCLTRWICPAAWRRCSWLIPLCRPLAVTPWIYLSGWVEPVSSSSVSVAVDLPDSMLQERYATVLYGASRRSASRMKSC
jgi:hypothetical protein